MPASVHFMPVSLKSAATVAIHGTYKSVKIMKQNASNPAVAPPNNADTPPKDSMEVTTASFATKPLKRAVTACHEPKPSGLKIKAAALPMVTIILSSPAPYPLVKEKFDSIHTMTLSEKIVVPTFIKNALILFLII